MTLVLSVPVLLLDEFIQTTLGYSLPVSGSPYIVVTLSTIIYIYGGWPFLSGLVNELRNSIYGTLKALRAAVESPG